MVYHNNYVLPCKFQHTAARRRLGKHQSLPDIFLRVSTHSRPKAAGFTVILIVFSYVFQHTAARRRLGLPLGSWYDQNCVSTHSRPKAAGGQKPAFIRFDYVSTHSRPKAAGTVINRAGIFWRVSTHSRPKAAGPSFGSHFVVGMACFNTQPPEGGWWQMGQGDAMPKNVSTHSRPKAAGAAAAHADDFVPRFNTQPPEGGW